MSCRIKKPTNNMENAVVDGLSKICGITRKEAKKRLDEFLNTLTDLALEGVDIDLTEVDKLTKKGKMK